MSPGSLADTGRSSSQVGGQPSAQRSRTQSPIRRRKSRRSLPNLSPSMKSAWRSNPFVGNTALQDNFAAR